MAYNQQETIFGSGSVDGSVRLWDNLSRDTRPIQILPNFSDSVTSILFLQDEILASSMDGHIRSFDIRVGGIVKDQIGEAVTGLAIS